MLVREACRVCLSSKVKHSHFLLPSFQMKNNTHMKNRILISRSESAAVGLKITKTLFCTELTVNVAFLCVSKIGLNLISKGVF